MIRKKSLNSEISGQFNALGFDRDRMTFSASVFLTLFFGLCLISKYVIWALFAITAIISIWQGYKLFFRKKVKFKGLNEV